MSVNQLFGTLVSLVLFTCAQVLQVTADGVFIECNRRGKERVPSQLDMCCFRYLRCRCIKALCLKSEYAKSDECEQSHLYSSECASTYNANCQHYQDSTFASKCNNTDPDLTANDKKDTRESAISSSTLTIVIVLVVIFIPLALIVVAIWWFCFRTRSNEKKDSSDKAGQSLASSGKEVSGRQSERTGSNKQQSSAKAQNINAHTARSKGGRQFEMLTAKKGDGKSRSTKRKGKAKASSSQNGGSFNSRAVNTRVIKENNHSNKATSNHEATKKHLKKVLK